MEKFAAKDFTVLNSGDAHLLWSSGGGGYGDPMERAPESVAIDHRKGLCSAETAASIYGVVLDSAGDVDREATATQRKHLREERLAEARPVSDFVAEVGVTRGSS